ncbi:MAG: 4-hydroxythreonine-4-phosphate dehydrogenase PdxA [Deltaproteobacteria bacterium]|nr:4-hydroxythreonine-4-phosphate dehydrogenase PdxA [Deltaproteobacteria bacterium]
MSEIQRTVGISMGDPAGIGPEIVVRALAARPDLKVRVFGASHILNAAAARMRLPLPGADRICSVTGGDVDREDIVPGRPNLASAHAQLSYLTAATDAALAGEIAALCTAPISKEWIARAGFHFPGHTEYLAARAGVVDFAMMLAGPRPRVVLATRHIALRDVPAQLTVEEIVRATVLVARTLVMHFGVGRARVAVAGLNPHAGEAGRFGDEEARLVLPGIRLSRAQLERERVPAVITGPHPPDAVFRQASLGGFDAVVALYHDQGLIPLKLLHFDDAVNVTLGLPFPRTSPDHGTAYDIAGTGRANPSSFVAALDLAAQLARS